MRINIDECLKYLGMDERYWRAAESTLEALLSDPAAAQLIRCAREAITARGDVPLGERVCRALLEHVDAAEPELRHMALAAVLGFCLDGSLARLRAQGVDEAVLTDSFRNFSIWAENYEKSVGTAGIGELPWILYTFCGQLFKLGRLMYETALFPFPYYVYRNNHSGEPVIMAKSGLDVTDDGRLLGTNGRVNPAVLRTYLKFSNDTVTGFCCDTKNAVIARSPVTLELKRHELLFCHMTRVLSIHIPAGEPLTPESVDSSFAAAKEFFAPRGYPCGAVICESWLLDPALSVFARGSVNSVKFMERYSKFPVNVPEPTAGKYIFPPDFRWPHWDAVEPKTSLQAAFKEYLASGGEIFDVGGVLTL